MELIITRLDDAIVIKKADELIEDYKLDKEVNFKGLIKLLLGQNLSEEIKLSDDVDSKTEAEENLVKIINDIVNDYNSKVTEFAEFVKNQEELDSK